MSHEVLPILNTSPFDELQHLNKERRDALGKFTEWCRYMQETGTPVDVTGFPLSATVSITNNSGKVHRTTAPCYSLKNDEVREPRSVTGGHIVSVTNGTVSVAVADHPNEYTYNFNINNLTAISESPNPGSEEESDEDNVSSRIKTQRAIIQMETFWGTDIGALHPDDPSMEA